MLNRSGVYFVYKKKNQDMLKNCFFIIIIFFSVFAVVGITSCKSTEKKEVNELEELGDTVPSSEFDVIEDTTTIPIKKDSIVSVGD